MAVHVVGFHDYVLYEDTPDKGRAPSLIGRKLLWAIYNKDDYQKIQSGDRKSIYPFRKNEFVDFVDPDSFVADLKLTENHFHGTTVTLIDELKDTYYPMFLSDFMAMVKSTVLTQGRVTGRFGFVKKNVNFGIVYLGEN